ncbi:MAG: DUF2225 domain-containing protein [Lachnospiraceae bacterium]|nr:DUF2225 domain-containing protein [Lachnospiraceae bacterium]
MGILSGLENFGLGKFKTDDIFNDGEVNVSEKAIEEQPVPKEFVTLSEADILFEKKYTCPVCDSEVKAKTVRAGKSKLVGSDTDLRPKYALGDPLKYDVVVCPKCGFGALARNFGYLTSGQIKLIRESISKEFKGLPESGDIYTYDEAIGRAKLALVSALVSRQRTSERAYLCLKIAWLIRGAIEEMERSSNPETKKIKEYKKEEDEYIIKAYEGFVSAFSTERFPMCGMDEMTTNYLVAELARKCGKKREAMQLVGKIILSHSASKRIKDKARELKELIELLPNDGSEDVNATE